MAEIKKGVHKRPVRFNGGGRLRFKRRLDDGGRLRLDWTRVRRPKVSPNKREVLDDVSLEKTTPTN